MPRMQISTVLERAVIVCLFLIALFAPHSIAVTQAAWLLGMVLWAARFAVYPRPLLTRSPVTSGRTSSGTMAPVSGTPISTQVPPGASASMA